MIKYSFVMPAYKAAFIQASINSILAQTYRDFELIIVDDASPEDIKSIVESYQDSRIRYYRNESNIGGADLVGQWNHSISYAHGDWIILATDDDVYEPEFLSKADSLLSKYSQVDIFRARIASFREGQNVLEYMEPSMPEYTSMEEFFYTMHNGLLGGIPEYAFRKSALDKIGGFVNLPKAWSSDDVTAMLLAKNGVACSGKVLVMFRYSGLNISTIGKFEEEKVKARFMRMAIIYKEILPFLKTDSAYERYWVEPLKRDYPFNIKRQLLDEMYKLPWKMRKKLLYLIDEYTPFLNSRNKKTMKFRVFFRIK